MIIKEGSLCLLGIGLVPIDPQSSFILTKVSLEWLDYRGREGGYCKLVGY